MAAYPEPGARHFRLDPAEVGPERGAFLVAFDDATDRPLGCGAVRVIEPGTGELKRMYVVPEARGKAVGWALVTALEGSARWLQCSRVVLETGSRQHAAMRLYERMGYVRIPAFGEYVHSPVAVCFGKDI
ncbi:MAG: GNAT family N-acetyltransferase [bacterium]